MSEQPEGGGGPLAGKPVAGIPRPIAVGGLVVVGVAGLVYLWRKHQAKKAAGSSSGSTVITGSSSTGIDNAMLDAILKDWQQHPSTTSGNTAASGTGTGSGSGSGGGGGQSTASGTGTTGPGSTTTTTPASPNASTTTNESGQMHGITTAQAQYLFDTGNQPYVYDAATNSYVRWSGMPVAGQTYYAGPLNWQDALQNGNVIGGTKGHPILKTSAAKKPAAKPPAKKPPAKKPPAKK